MIPRKLTRYALSEDPDKDLGIIFEYKKENLGSIKGVHYLTDLESVFNCLIKNPNPFRTRNEIRKHLFSIPEQEYIIFYRIEDETIRIVRVLHGSRDLPVSFQ